MFRAPFPLNRWIAAIASLTALATLLGSCAEPATPPGDVSDMALLIVGGNHQTGAPDTELALPLTVKATAPSDEPIAGVVIFLGT